jgi:hypothetical protein
MHNLAVQISVAPVQILSFSTISNKFLGSSDEEDKESATYCCYH